jgi:hypothetical protein
LYAKNGKISYVYNWVGLKLYSVTAAQSLPPGKATIRFDFTYDGGKPGSGGNGTIFLNGQKAGEGRIDQTNGFVFSADETADVGQDDATPVTEDYKEGDNKFTGKIQKVVIDLKK